MVADSWCRTRDVPWWYNERASVSVFAGAVWQAGGVALEEFTDEKKIPGRRGRAKRVSYSGRTDLYFELGRYEFLAEAKRCVANLWNPRVKDIDSHLTHACRDAQRLPRRGVTCLGMVFVLPCLHTNRRDLLDEYISRWSETMEAIETGASAFVFPSSARGVTWGHWIHPGAAVLIREA